jgi:general nucleoside transport system ATP-binding protein
MMVGDTPPEQRVAQGVAGPALMRLDAVGTPDRGAAPGLKDGDPDASCGADHRARGRVGQRAGGAGRRDRGPRAARLGAHRDRRRGPAAWSPGAALAAGVGRIPEDRHRTGTIGDFTLTENAVLERVCRSPASPRRASWTGRAAEAFAQRIIDGYDVRCPGPSARVRLLSGGNMQKMILGRVLEAGPRIILANQPVQGLDVGAIAYVHGRLVAARDAAPRCS